jgi:hypothetical protein
MLAVVSGAQAEEVKRRVKSVDADKGSVTLTVGEEDRTLDVAQEAKITHRVGKNEKKDDKDVVTRIKVDALAPRKK